MEKFNNTPSNAMVEAHPNEWEWNDHPDNISNTISENNPFNKSIKEAHRMSKESIRDELLDEYDGIGLDIRPNESSSKEALMGMKAFSDLLKINPEDSQSVANSKFAYGDRLEMYRSARVEGARKRKVRDSINEMELYDLSKKRSGSILELSKELNLDQVGDDAHNFFYEYGAESSGLNKAFFEHRVESDMSLYGNNFTGGYGEGGPSEGEKSRVQRLAAEIGESDINISGAARSRRKIQKESLPTREQRVEEYLSKREAKARIGKKIIDSMEFLKSIKDDGNVSKTEISRIASRELGE